jgi:lactate permease
MIYLLWSLPALTVIGAIASGRVNTTVAAVLGLCAAIPIALIAAPAPVGGAPFGGAQLAVTLERGAWIGWIITPYILGGLLFWQMASSGHGHGQAPATSSTTHQELNDPLARRRRLFFACFLIGPFAESATGFGVGMLGTVLLIRPLGLKPRDIMVFALLSQTLIPWGAMGSGTLLASAYARVPAPQLALYSMVAVALLMIVWMLLFWRTARHAGLRADTAEHGREAAWITASLGLLSAATAVLGPETALLASFGPLIVLRFVLDRRPDRVQALAAARRALPYMLVIACLTATRLVPALNHALGAWADIQPFADLPAWKPFLHAGSWLIAGALALAAWRREPRALKTQAPSA